jgi:hypothetical protein
MTGTAIKKSNGNNEFERHRDTPSTRRDPCRLLRNVRHADRLEVDAVAVGYRDPLS